MSLARPLQNFGVPIHLNHTLRRNARVIAHLDDHTIHLLNKAILAAIFWPLRHGLFIMKAVAPVCRNRLDGLHEQVRRCAGTG